MTDEFNPKGGDIYEYNGDLYLTYAKLTDDEPLSSLRLGKTSVFTAASNWHREPHAKVLGSILPAINNILDCLRADKDE